MPLVNYCTNPACRRKCLSVALPLELPLEELNNLYLFLKMIFPQNSSVTTSVYNHHQVTQRCKLGVMLLLGKVPAPDLFLRELCEVRNPAFNLEQSILSIWIPVTVSLM